MTITDADVISHLAEQPAFTLARYKTLDRKKELLDGMIRQELLLQEARRRGLESDPEVRSTMEKVLIHKLARVYSDELDRTRPIPAAELRRYYDQHLSEFVTPTRVHVSHLFIAAPVTDPRRPRAAGEAQKLLQQIKARIAKGEKQVLELTASQRSDDAATKATGGDLGYKTREQLTQAWGATFTAAAFALETPGEVGPLVTTQNGFHLLKLQTRQEGYETPFDSAKSRIESRLAIERRSHAVDELAAELRKHTQVQIDENALGKIDVTPVAGATVARP